MTQATVNSWQRKAQEPDRFKYGAWRRPNDTYFRAVALDVTEGPKMNAAHDGSPLQQTYLPLPAILEHLAYERQECGTCEGDGGCICVLCDPDDRRYAGKSEPCGTHEFIYVDYEEYGESCHGTGLTPDYRKAQEWAERLGLEDG